MTIFDLAQTDRKTVSSFCISTDIEETFKLAPKPNSVNFVPGKASSEEMYRWYRANTQNCATKPIIFIPCESFLRQSITDTILQKKTHLERNWQTWLWRSSKCSLYTLMKKRFGLGEIGGFGGASLNVSSICVSRKTAFLSCLGRTQNLAILYWNGYICLDFAGAFSSSCFCTL
jgi:hypothetical protein